MADYLVLLSCLLCNVKNVRLLNIIYCVKTKCLKVQNSLIKIIAIKSVK